MGRRDAVQVTLEVVARMRQILPGLVVSYEPGWETRGNGTSANYEGGLVHHTASPSSLLKPFPTQTVLRQGRADLPGPLCNFAGPACTTDAPRLHVMAANPANHAGASGGRSMGPLPRTSLFNPRVLGLEIDYAGSVPMLAGQLLVAQVWSRVVADVVGGGDIERVRAHYETSVTGKWDIGAGAGSVDMNAFRRTASAIATSTPQEDDVQLTDRIKVRGGTAEISVAEALGRAFDVYDAVFNGGGSTPYGASLLNLVDDLPRRVTAETAAQVAGLQTALAAARSGQPIDLKAVEAAARSGAAQALQDGVTVTVDVPGRSGS